MLARLASVETRHPRRTLAIAAVLFLIAVVLGAPAAGKLQARNSFEDPGSQVAHARKQIEHASGTEATPGVLAIVKAPPLSPATLSAAHTLASDPAVARVASFASTHDPSLVSQDGKQSLLAATLHAGPAPTKAVDRLTADFARRHDVLLGGPEVSGNQVNKQATKDLGFAELLAFPLLALLTLFVFRGVAALLPITVGGISVMGAFLVLRGVNVALPLSAFALNVVIGLGLGLAIDWALLLVSRFREELAAEAEPDIAQAVITTMKTAGRTVAFSSITVAAAIASLTLFPFRFLQSMGIGGAATALLAGAVALTVLPAMLVLLGRRIGRSAPPVPENEGRWYRLAHAVMRRPGLVAVVTTAGLLLLASPVLRVKWSGVDASILPTSQSARVVSDTLSRDFPHRGTSQLVLAVTAPPSASPELASYTKQLKAVTGVVTVSASRNVGGNTWQIDVLSRGDPITAPAQATLHRVRSAHAPFPVLVGGQAAGFADQQSALAASLPLALGVLAFTTLFVLWLMTDSVVLPIKALLMNVLTVAAATGLLVLIFQDGRLTGPLGYTSQGGLESTDFVLLAAIAFGLSTDYGVFLLTRIKEARDGGLPDREAIAVGLQRTGRIVTAAAVLLAVAIGAFSTSKIVFLKEVGVGAAVAVLIDAFIIRTLLVPALMALLGRWNWWSPRPLHRLHGLLSTGNQKVTASGPPSITMADS